MDSHDTAPLSESIFEGCMSTGIEAFPLLIITYAFIVDRHKCTRVMVVHTVKTFELGDQCPFSRP